MFHHVSGFVWKWGISKLHGNYQHYENGHLGGRPNCRTQPDHIELYLYVYCIYIWYCIPMIFLSNPHSTPSFVGWISHVGQTHIIVSQYIPINFPNIYIYNYMYSYACYFAILVKLQLLTSSPTCFIIFQVLEVIGIYIVYISVYTHTHIYIYIRQMPGLCPEPQPRQATHHHHHHHHQTLIEDLQWMYKFDGGGRFKPLLKIFNECRSLTGVGELNPYRRSSMNVEV